jgi:hypothetical protein
MKTAVQNVINTLKGKKVLFLEGDNGLYHGLDRIEKILIEEGIEYKALFEVRSLPMTDIVAHINEYDAIIFQTQWVYEVSQEIKRFAFGMKDKKIFIECYISEPTWYYKPKVVHDVYIFKGPLKWQSDEDIRFYKLSQKAYWDYKNKFNR